MKFHLNFLIILTFIFTPFTSVLASDLNPCELSFVKYIGGKLPAEVSGTNTVNLWSEVFDANLMIEKITQGQVANQLDIVKELARYVGKDKVYTKNLSDLVTKLYEKKLISQTQIKKIFLQHEFQNARFFWSPQAKKLTSQINISQEKIAVVDNILANSGVSKRYRKEYRDILLQSDRTADDLVYALNNGLILHNSSKHLEQFRHYFEYLDQIRASSVRKGLKNIEKIYDFKYQHSFLTIDTVLPPHKQFLAQKSRINTFEQKRVTELMNEYKLREKDKISKELIELEARIARGEKVLEAEKRQLQAKLDEIELPQSLRKRALRQAAGEKEIYRRMMNGCNSGSSPRLANAAKKFKRFKVALSLTTVPTFYLMKNWDKREEDPFFWEQLGYEVTTGLAFTFVANKLITNNNTSFLQKYIEGYVKFGAMDGVINGFGFEQLFGANAHIRYLQRLYRPDVTDSQIEKELKVLMESPTFEDDLKNLMSYLEEKSKDRNLKNLIEQTFNVGAYNSIDGDMAITAKDLESEEAREVLMELLAERLYLQNMGDWPIFQSGNKGADRWLFYRGRNVLYDIKAVAVNLAIFQIMCREPFGKIGSWAAVFSLVIADQMISGNFTYGLRREAINQ